MLRIIVFVHSEYSDAIWGLGSRFSDRVKGFSLIELILTIAIIGVLGVGIWSSWVLGLQVTSQKRIEVTANALANEQIERVRSLPYSSVGTIGGIPSGTLAQQETVERNAIPFTVTTSIFFIDDPFDKTAPEDPISTDYKRVRIIVQGPDPARNRPVQLVTDVAPPGLETALSGGTLFLTITNRTAAPVAGATVTIANASVSPPIALTVTTDSEGQIILPGAPVGQEAYDVTVTKDEYSRDGTIRAEVGVNPSPTKPPLSVFEGTVTEGVFSIDQVSTLDISTNKPRNPATWWRATWLWKRDLTIANEGSTELPAGTPVEVLLDHGALVAEGKAQGGGGDVRIVFAHGGTYDDLPREAQSAWNSNEPTSIWFTTQRPILPQESDSGYAVYYGNPSARYDTDVSVPLPGQFTDDDRTDFNNGTYQETAFADDQLRLTAEGIAAHEGEYLSSVKDAGATATWKTLAWTPLAPYGKPLPNNGAQETAYSAGNVDMTGNVLLLHMDETHWSGTTKDVQDGSGRGNDGKAIGGISPTREGVIGTAGNFDGDNDYVALQKGTGLGIFSGLPDVPPPEYTAEAWLTMDALQHRIAIFSGWSGNFWIGSGDDGAFAAGVHSGPKDKNLWDYVITRPTVYAKDTWHHVVQTYTLSNNPDEKHLHIYVDGEQVNEASLVQGLGLPLTDPSTTHPPMIGAATTNSNGTPGLFWKGGMDEVAVYNRVLSTSDIRDRYARGALTITFQIRSCNDPACDDEPFVGPDGTPQTSYKELMNATDALPLFPLTNVPDNRYFQYRARLTTIARATSPALNTVKISYASQTERANILRATLGEEHAISSPPPRPNVAFTLRGEKTIGNDDHGKPIYAYQKRHVTDGRGQLTINALAWDTYTATVDPEEEGYDTSTTAPILPLYLPPDTKGTIALTLVPHAPHTLRVTVYDDHGTPLPDASVRLVQGESAYDVTLISGETGQAFFSPLAGEVAYLLTVTHTGYTTTVTDVPVNEQTTQEVTITPL